MNTTNNSFSYTGDSVTAKPANVSQRIDTHQLVMTAMFIALTYVATAFINVRIPFLAANGGLIHLGNIPVFIAAALYGKNSSMISGSFGMALFDLTSGWVPWAPFTFIICGLIGFTFGLILQKGITKWTIFFGTLAAVVIKVAGYYVAEGIITGNWITPSLSIPGNIVQITVAGIISLPLILAIKKGL